jgi:tRNA(His) guanylyltransferase
MEKTLGDRMKRYEMEEAGRRMIPLLPIMARLDGRAFHTLTKGLARPYSPEFTRCMVETAAVLVNEFGADLAYTQSDEISLFWKNDDPFAPMQFDGRFQKWTSLLSAEASVAFNMALLEHLPEKAATKKKRAKLDCRVWQLPNTMEVYNAFLWREDDATRNSLQMAAQSHYTQKELHKAGEAKLHDMLHAKGVNWNDFPAFFKRGTYIARRQYQRELTADELAGIPEDRRPTGPIMRSGIFALKAEPLRRYTSMTAFFNNAVGRDYQIEGI